MHLRFRKAGLDVDLDAKLLGVSTNDIAFLDKAISMLKKGDMVDVAQRILFFIHLLLSTLQRGTEIGLRKTKARCNIFEPCCVYKYYINF